MSSAEIFPSESLNKTLVLGRSLYHTVSKLRESHQRMEISYSSENYLDMPLLMSLPKLGVRVMFDSTGTQPMRLIEVLNFEHLKLLYKGNYLNDIVYHTLGDEEFVECQKEGQIVHVQPRKHVSCPTLKEVYNKIFGPTFPGELHEKSNTYILSYPGIAFRFEIRSKELCGRVAALNDKNQILSRLTNWETANDIPCVSLVIFQGEDYSSFIGTMKQSTRKNQLPASLPSSSDLAIENVQITLSTGTADLCLVSKHQRTSASIQIGKSTQQDILRLLGPPDSYFNKFDSRLSIHKHLRPGPKEGPSVCSVYKFHNYFRYGIDFLYNLSPASGNGGVLEKIVIHNGGNIKSLDFMQWNKCNWTIQAKPGHDASVVNSEMYFREFDNIFLEQIQSKSSEPVLLNRADIDNADDYELELVSSEEFKHTTLNVPESSDSRIVKNMKTWGQSRLHGYQRCILEVNESNNCVSCVTIY